MSFFKIEENTPYPSRKIIGIVTFSFLLFFVLSRLVVYLILGHLMPNFFLTIRGVHIHHFTYGVFILSLVGLYLLLKRPTFESKSFVRACILYGIGLALTFDEFGMWIMLDDNYWVRQSYDAVIVIMLLFVNLAYFHTIRNWLVREWRSVFKKI